MYESNGTAYVRINSKKYRLVGLRMHKDIYYQESPHLSGFSQPRDAGTHLDVEVIMSPRAYTRLTWFIKEKHFLATVEKRVYLVEDASYNVDSGTASFEFYAPREARW